MAEINVKKQINLFKNPIYIKIAIFLLADILIIIFGIYPIVKDIKASINELAFGQKNMAFLENQVNEIENFKKNASLYKDNIDKAISMFINSENPVDFIEFLETASSSSEITSEISIPANKEDTKSATAIFQISAIGKFSNVIKFLEKIESGNYLVKVQNLTLKKIEDSSLSKTAKRVTSDNVKATLLISVISK